MLPSSYPTAGPGGVFKNPDIMVNCTRTPRMKSLKGVKRKVSVEDILMFQLKKRLQFCSYKWF